jgi:acyl carrier protein
MDTKPQLRKYIADNILMGPEQELGDETSFLERGILDSTGFLELVSFLEQTFGMTVDDDEMVPENLDSLSRIDAYVQRKLGKAA